MGNTVKKSKMGYHTSFFERLSYGFYFFGQNIFYVTVAMFLLPFFMDIGIPAAVVGVVTLIVKIWDAVNDPIFGGIIDKVKLKGGKFLPWLRVSLVFIPLATILLFAAGIAQSDVVKVIWVTVAYMLWDTAYTMCDVPIFGIVTTMTDNQTERVSIMSFGRMFGILGAILGMFIIPTVRVTMGGWLPTVIALSVIGTIVMIPLCLVGKERCAPKAAEKDISFKEMFKYVISNKYLLIFFGAATVKAALEIGQGLTLYIGRYLLGNEQIMGLIGLTIVLPTIVMGIFGRLLIKKFDKFNLLWWALFASVLISIVLYFVGYGNLLVYIILSFLRGIASGVFAFLIYMFTPDCAEYGTYKTGIAATGSAFAFQSFSTKVGSALATSIAAFALAATGFISGENAVQAAGFNDKLWNIACWVPIIGGTIALIVLRFYKPRDKDINIMIKANYGEITREEAEKLLEGSKF